MNNVQASFLFSAALPAALLLLLLHRRKHPWTLPLLLWIAVPWILFTLLSNKDARYTVPVLPAVAILIGAGLTRFRWRFLAVALPGLLLAAGVLQCLQISGGLFGTIPAVPLLRRGGGTEGPAVYLYVPKAALRVRPHPAPRGALSLLKLLKIEALLAQGKGKKQFEVRHLFDLPDVTAPVEQAFCLPNLHARYTGEGVRVQIRAGFFDTDRAFREADLLLVKRKGDRGWLFREHTRNAVKAFEARADRFEALGRFEGPDGHAIEAYRPKKQRIDHGAGHE
jgi:hypothetical protein